MAKPMRSERVVTMAQQMVRLADEAWQTQVAEEVAEAVQQSGERLCFGYFHLARQMKVTRHAGAKPGAEEQDRQKPIHEAAHKELAFDTSGRTVVVCETSWIPALAKPGLS
ncbi:MAG: hypothetical protein ABI605_22035 [Rhizobacter sp.]